MPVKKFAAAFVIGMLLAGVVVGAFYFVSHRKPGTDEVSEVQKVILKDLSGDAYPASPREVVKFYNRILCCYYNETYTDEELKQLADQALALFDKELADNNPAEQYYLRVQTEVEEYRKNGKTINNTSVCSTNEVKYDTINGAECALLSSSYFMRDNDGFERSSQNYILRKDDGGNWKILAFELAKKDEAQDE